MKSRKFTRLAEDRDVWENVAINLRDLGEDTLIDRYHRISSNR